MRLDEDEHLLLELRAAGSVLAVPVLVLLAVLAGLGFGLAATRGTAQLAVGAAALVLLLPFCLVPFLRWRAGVVVLTDRRLVVRSGVLSRTGRDVPLTRVDEVSFRRTLRQRLLGRGTLVVVAGDGAPVEVPDLPAVEQVQRDLQEAVGRAVERQRR